MTSECRVCGSSKLKKILVTKPLPEYVWPIEKTEITLTSEGIVYQCKECHHLQLQEFSDKDISKFYKYGSYILENMAAKEERLKKILIKYGEGYFVNKNILDVGGGSNPFVKLLNDYSNHLCVSDFEIHDKTMQFCNGNVYQGMFEDADIPIASFDAILSFHSMEHMNNPALVVKKMRTLLKDDGHVIVEVPNIIDVVKTIPYFSVFHQHINLFTKNSLINLFLINGFKLDCELDESSVLLMVFSLSNELEFFENENMADNLMEEVNEKMEFLDKKIIKLILKYKPKNLGVYGAGGSTSLLLHHIPSLNKNMKCCFDREILKQGKYIPGTEVKVSAPESLLESDFVIFLNDEMKFLFSEKISIPNFSVAEILREYKSDIS